MANRRNWLTRSWLTTLSIVLLLSQTAAMAQVAPTPVQLDLSSPSRSIHAQTNSATPAAGAVINVGGVQRTINPGDMVTAAELTALTQVLNTGSQQLQLNSLGAAIGGSVNLNAMSAALSSLLIPTGVTAVHDFATGEQSLNVNGNMTNAGSFYAVSSQPQITNAIINATNIYNQHSAILSSRLPASGLPGVTSAVSNLSLTLNALHDIVNAGTITSAGSLTMRAGGSITNALPPNVSAPTPVISAVNDVNLIASNITNAGIISSATANVNLATQLASNLHVNNTGGRIEALNGAINVRDVAFVDKMNTTIRGGDFVARELNLFSGQGILDVVAKNIEGRVNISAGEAHLTAATPNLKLGRLQLTGDPTFYNTDGDVELTGDISTGGGPLAVVAEGNITGTSGLTKIETEGGSILMLAGANVSTTEDMTGTGEGSDSTSTELFITTPTLDKGGDGKIDFSGSGLTSISSSATAGSGEPAGNIELVAYGDINLSGVSISANGDGDGNNGNVTLISGSSSFSVVTVSDIDASLGGGIGGSISLFGTAPVIFGTAIGACNPCVKVGATGAIESGDLTTNAANAFSNLVSEGSLTAGGDIFAKFMNIQVKDSDSKKMTDLRSTGLVEVNGLVFSGDAMTVVATEFDLAPTAAVTVGDILDPSIEDTLEIATPFFGEGDVVRLQLSGGGLISATGGTTIKALSGRGGPVAFDSGFGINGNLKVEAGGGRGVISVRPGEVVNVGGDIVLEGSGLVNRDGFFSQTNAFAFNLNLEDAPFGNGGTIVNSFGDVRLTKNLMLTGDLVIIASGDVIGAGIKKIDLGANSAFAGGSLTILAGAEVTPGTDGQINDPSTIYEFVGASASGGSVQLANVQLDTSATTKSAGDITVLAFAGAEDPGSVTVGALNAGATTGDGGDIKVYGRGGIKISGAIKTDGGVGGSISLSQEQPSSFGSIFFQNGTKGGGGSFTPDFNPTVIAQPEGGISVTGAVSANGTGLRGGSIFVFSSNAIDIPGAITATGFKSGSLSNPVAGGEVYIESTSSRVRVGNVDVSGKDGESFFDPDNGGGEIYLTGALIEAGSLTSKGGKNSEGTGGKGGYIQLQNLLVSFLEPERIGQMLVKGAINVSGGAGNTAGSGGAGGSVFISAGAVRLTAGGVAIQASGGDSTANPGSVNIETYGTQPIPLNFDFLGNRSTGLTEFALPGGLFLFGDGVVNGTVGDIVAGPNSLKNYINGVGGPAHPDAKRVVEGSAVSVGSINISANLSESPIEYSQGPSTISSDGGVLGSSRTKITPGEALALYQQTRGTSQGMQVDQQSGMVVGFAGDSSSIVIDQRDILSPFKQFVVSTAGGNPDVQVVFTGRNLNLDLSATKTSLINGLVVFNGTGILDPVWTQVSMGSKVLTVQPGARVLSINSNRVTIQGKINNNGRILMNDLTLRGSSLVINGDGGVNGQLRANNLVLASVTAIKLAMNPSAVLGGIDGDNGLLVINAPTFTVTGGTLDDTTLTLHSSQKDKGTISVISGNTTDTVFLGDMDAKKITIGTFGPLATNQSTIRSKSGMTISTGGDFKIGDATTFSSGDTMLLTSNGVLDVGTFVEATSAKNMTLGGTSIKVGTGSKFVANSGKLLASTGFLTGSISSTGTTWTAPGGVTFETKQLSIASGRLNTTTINSFLNINAIEANVVIQFDAGTTNTLYVGKLTSLRSGTLLGGMTIAAKGGDIVLSQDIDMAGVDLALIGERGITGKDIKTGNFSIRGTATAKEAGDITLLTGYAPTTTVSQGVITNIGIVPASLGGNISVGYVDAASVGDDSGQITIVANNPDPAKGPSITAANVTSVSSVLSSQPQTQKDTGAGGDITIIAPGTMVLGGVVSSGLPGGDVKVSGSSPVAAGTFNYLKGRLVGSGVFNAPSIDPGSEITFNNKVGTRIASGSVGSNGVGFLCCGQELVDDTFDFGGNVTLEAGRLISMPGLLSGDRSNFNIRTVDGRFETGGIFNFGGSVTINSMHTSINGNVIGLGGMDLTILSTPINATVLDNLNVQQTVRVGSVFIKEYVNLDGFGSPGFEDGGALEIRTGTLQVGLFAGFEPGTSYSITTDSTELICPICVAGQPGTVLIQTFGTQPIPTNFNPISTSKTEYVLPGGIFSVKGNTNLGLGNIVNGTSSEIVSGTEKFSAVTTGSDRIANATLISPSGRMKIQTFINEITLTDQLVPEKSDNGANTPRNKVTPGTALALFQKSRAMDQDILLNGSGQILDGSSISLNGYELNKPFTNFVFTTAGPSQAVFMTISGAAPYLDLEKSTLTTLQGRMIFDTIGNTATIKLDKKGLILHTTGSITGENLLFIGNSPKWEVFGPITGSNIEFRNNASALNFILGSNGNSLFPTRLGKIGTPGEIRFTGNAALTISGNVDAKIQSYVSVSGGPFRAKSVTLGKDAANAVYFANGAGLGDVLTGGAILVNSGSAMSVGAGRTVSSDSADIKLAIVGDVNLGNQSTLTAAKLLQIGTTGNVTIGDNSLLNGRSSLSIVAGGENSNLNIGSGVVIKAAQDIALSAKIDLVFAGGDNLTGKSLLVSATNISSTAGGNLFIANGTTKSRAFGSDKTVKDALQFSSDFSIDMVGQNTWSSGGGVGFYRFKDSASPINLAGTLSASKGGVMIQARGSGAVNVDADITTVGGGITIDDVINTLPLEVLSGAVTVSGSWKTDGNIYVRTNGAISVLAGTTMQSGQLALMAPTAGVLVKTDIVKAGGITLQGDSVDLGSTGAFGTTLISNGGTILLRATSNDIKLGDLASSALLKANGGNVQLLAEGSVTGGHGNEFIARAAGTVGSHAGGAIEITAGSTFSRLTPALTLPGGTVPPDLSVLGSDIAIENRVRNAATGVVVAAINGGTVDLNAGPVDARTTLNLSRGFIVFGADGGNSVELDGATFSVDSYKPIAYRTPSSSCLSALKNTTVRTGLGDVYAKKGAVVSIVYENGMVRVAALSGPGDVRVIAGGRTIALAPGQELLLADRQITSEESHPSDGVGRRNITHHDLGDGIVACISDISIVSMIQNAAHMRTLRKPASQAERAVLGQMIKTAAAIEHITRDRGRYEARPAVKRMDDRWTPVSFKR